MMHSTANPTPCWEFEGDILVLHHPTTISPKYQAMGEYINKVIACDVNYAFMKFMNSGYVQSLQCTN